MRSLIQRLLMPPAYLPAIRGLDHVPAGRPEPRGTHTLHAPSPAG
jgi:hypothetical protein